MTRIKKGLLAVLLCIMAIALGAASLLMFGTAKAESISASTARTFITAVSTFDKMATENEDGSYSYPTDGLFAENSFAKYPESDYTYRQLWSAYANANRYYNNYHFGDLTAAEVAEHEGLDVALKKYTGLDKVFGELYGYAARINANMTEIVGNGYKDFKYSDSVRVNELYNVLDLLENGDSAANPAVAPQPGRYAYVAYTIDTNLQALVDAHDFVQQREEAINEIMAAIQDIENYNQTESNVVTIADGPAIEAVTKLIKEKLHATDIDYLTTTANYEADVKLEEGSDETTHLVFKTEYAKYAAAKAAYDKLTDAANKYMADVKALYESLSTEEGKEVYYTKKADIDALQDLYENGWAGNETLAAKYGTISVADLQTLVNRTNYKDAIPGDSEAEPPVDAVPAVTYKDVLDEMQERLAEIETEIAAVVEKIQAVVNFDGTKYIGSYKDADVEAADPAYRDLIAIAMAAFEALDNDIKVNDNAVYGKTAAEGVTYLVIGSGENAVSYGDLAAAYDEYLAWDSQLEAAIEAVKELAEKIVTLQGTNYLDLLDSSALASDLRSALNEEQEAIFVVTDVTVTYTVEEEEKEDTRTAPQWLSAANTFLDKIAGSVGALVGRISAYDYSFTSQATLVDLLQTYYSLSENERNLVSNRDKLMEMKDAYSKDLSDIKAWQDAIKAIELETIDGKDYVTVKNMGAIAELKEVFEALKSEIASYYTLYANGDLIEISDEDLAAVDGKTILDAEVFTANQVTTLLNLLYNSYIGSVEVYNAYTDAQFILNNAIKAATDAFPGLLTIKNADGTTTNIKAFDNLTVKDATIWQNSVNGLTEAYDALAEYKGSNSLVSYAGAQEYVEAYVYTSEDKQVTVSWETYQSALGYVERYTVEAHIAEIWKDWTGNGTNNGYEGMVFYDYDRNAQISLDVAQNAGCLDYISLKLSEKIDAAKKEYDAYTAKEGALEIRNSNFLDAALEQLETLNSEVLAWQRAVTALAGTMSTEGYGLDLDAWFKLFNGENGYDKLVGGVWTVVADGETVDEGVVTVTAYTKKVEGDVTTYEEVTYKLVAAEGGAIDAEKVEALAKSFEDFLGLLTKSNTAIAEFDAKLAAIIEKHSTESGLEPADYKLVTEYKLTYSTELSAYQKALLENWEDFNKLELGAIEIATAFNQLVDTLHEIICGTEEVDGTVTALVPAYLEYVNTLYASYDDDVKAAIGTEYAKKLAAIKAAYEAATLPDYDAKIAELEGKIEELETAVGAVDGKITDAKKEITDAYEKVIEALKTALEAKDTELTTAIKNAQKDLTALNAKLDKDIAELEADVTAAYEAALDELEAKLKGNINALQTKLDEVNETLASESKKITANEVAIAELKTQQSNLEKALETAKAALNADIVKVSNALKESDDKLAQATTDIANIKTQISNLENAVDDMQAQIDKLSSSITGLTVGIIIVAVATAAALAGAIVLFIKRKQN